jgi:hypothetical protein
VTVIIKTDLNWSNLNSAINAVSSVSGYSATDDDVKVQFDNGLLIISAEPGGRE